VRNRAIVHLRGSIFFPGRGGGPVVVLWENNVDLQGIGQNGDYREREEVCAQLWVEWLVLGWMDGSV
jgi:hypothetical protein